MSLEAAFLPDIVADPEDDAPRLVDADWLSENGDEARAEYVRLACERGKLSGHAPRALALDDRLRDLLRANEDGWRAGWPAYAREHVEFRRGLPSRVRLPARLFLKHGRPLRKRFPITSVYLEDVAGLLGAVLGAGLLDGLGELEINAQSVGPEEVAGLAGRAGLASLRRLNLRDSPVSADGVRTLLTSPHLAGLTALDICCSDGSRLEKVFRSGPLPKLRELVAICCKITPGGAAALANSSLADSLESLDLGHSAIGCAGTVALVSSPRLRHLRSLNLECCELEDSAVAELASSPRMAALTHLSLAHNGLTVKAARALADSPRLAALRSLDLSSTRVVDEGLGLLASSPRLAALESLRIWMTGVTDAGLAALAASPMLPRLRELNLSWSALTTAGLEALARSPRAAGLITLHLAECNIDDDGARALADSPHLGRLRTLSLYGNHIGRAGVEALARSASLAGLRYLNLQYMPLDDAAALALAGATWREGIERVEVGCYQFSPEVRARLAEAFGGRIE